MHEENVIGAILCSQWRDDGTDEARKKSLLEVILVNFGASVAVPSLFQISYHNILNTPTLSHLVEEVKQVLC